MSVIYVPSGRGSAPAPAVRRLAMPSLSLVVTSLGQRPALERGLHAMMPAAQECAVEVLVVRADTPSQLSELALEFTGVRFVMATPGATRDELLMLGMAEATGHIVSFSEDSALATGDWRETFARRQGRWVPRPLAGDALVTDWLAVLRATGLGAPGNPA